MAIGAVVQRIFALDMATLSKLNFYVFVPGIVFAKSSTTTSTAASSGRSRPSTHT